MTELYYPEEPIFPTGLDSTMLSAFDACPQKWFYEFCLRRVPVGRNIHLHAGGAFAKALEVTRRRYFGDGWAMEDCLNDAWIEYCKFWGDYEAPENQYKDHTNMWSALVAYFKEYPLDKDPFTPVIDKNGEPCVEFRFAIPMKAHHPETGAPLLFSGRLDQLSTDTPDTCYAQDEKTTKALGTAWYHQWKMRGQFHGYTYAARQYGYPCVGALVRGIAIQQTQFQFAEQPIILTTSQVDRWWEVANRRAEQMVEAFIECKQAWYEGDLRGMHDAFMLSFGDACSSYGGCAFTNLCLQDEPWHTYETYETRVWNPLEQDPTAESEDRLSKMGQGNLADFMQGM